MKKNTKKYFNLIELSLAIGILAIGATAVLALFPVGLQFNRDSVGENYCSMAAANFFAYISRRANESSNKWDALFMSGAASLIPPTKPSTEVNSTSDWSQAVGGGDMNNIYFVNDDDPPIPGVYGIKIETDSVIDFSGEVLIWCDANEDTAKLEIEISWPLIRPYLTRNKNYYCLYLYNNS